MIRTGVGLGSGNTDLLEILLSGSDVWNQWRMENPDTQINLSNADLRNTDLRNTDLRDTNLRFANLRSATISEETKINFKWKLVHELVNTGGEEKDLRRVHLSSADLSNANLIGAVLRFTHFSNANLCNANLSNARLSGAKLCNANLCSANLYKAKLISANIRIADLRCANLSEAVLRFANLSEANLCAADLHNANLSSAKLIGADLSSADLSSADLNYASLSSTILLNTDLRKTKNLTQAQLEGKEQPLICNSPLPQNIKIDPNRDCDKIAAVLLEKYSQRFSSLEEAKQYVQEQRQKKWN